MENEKESPEMSEALKKLEESPLKKFQNAAIPESEALKTEVFRGARILLTILFLFAVPRIESNLKSVPALDTMDLL